MSRGYPIIFARNVRVCLEFIDRKHHSLIRDAILEQLPFEPLTLARNRKPLDPAIFGATWELRCGPQNRYRVLYEVKSAEDPEDTDEVHVLLIGEKIGQQLLIMGKEVNDEADSPI